MFHIKNIQTITNMKGRQLPRTTTIIHHENSALKNKVKCLEKSLESAYGDIQTLTMKYEEAIKLSNEYGKLKEENEKLKEENENVKTAMRVERG
jgi:hypothetical protein